MVHCQHQHGEAKLKEHQHCQKLSRVNDEAADDDGPWPKEIVKGEVIQDLDAAAQERQPDKEVPDVNEDRPVFFIGEHCGHVDSNGNHIQENNDNFDRAKSCSVTWRCQLP